MAAPVKKEKFPGEMAKWIADTLPQFQAKLGINKPHVPGQSDPVDDSDLTDFKKLKYKEFQDAFGKRLDDIPNCRDIRFLRLDASANSPTARPGRKQRWGGPGRKVDATPSFLQPAGMETKGREHFRKVHNAAHSAEATQRRTDHHQDHHFHVGHYQTVVKEHWDGMSPEQQLVWEEKAEKENRNGVVSCDSEGMIYKNQSGVIRHLFEVMYNLIGPHSNQIGNGAFLLLYGFRNTEEKLDVGSLPINGEGFSGPKFEDYDPTVVAALKKTWWTYCNEAIGTRCLPRTFLENGTMAEYHMVLKLFMEGSFDLVWPRCSEMPALPWESFLEHPTEFLDPRLLMHGVLSRPDAMTPAHIHSFAGCINEFQATHPTLTIFNAKPFIQACLESYPAEPAPAVPEDEEIIPRPSPSPSPKPVPPPKTPEALPPPSPLTPIPHHTLTAASTASSSSNNNGHGKRGRPQSDDESRMKLKLLSISEWAASPENPPRRSGRGRKQSTSKPKLHKEGKTVKGMKGWAVVSDSSESNEE
ncbi:hypothetical protein C8J57DRAFT_1252893 [Mycena rebaudengoi]|nr:hypothetical protein C8J57DRAFT_1252893 [Mycena rebaudengoi]